MSSATAVIGEFPNVPRLLGRGVDGWINLAAEVREEVASREQEWTFPAMRADRSLTTNLTRFGEGAIARFTDTWRDLVAEGLNAARSEAVALGDPSVVPLTEAARIRCVALAADAIDRCFHLEWIQMVATAKLNGGATFVARNLRNARRIDVEVEPQGNAAQFVATERSSPVSVFAFDMDQSVFAAWLDWLLR